MPARNLTYCPASSVAAPPAATYSLLPVTYSLNHSFSAKERDAETGLSYFGARYYSSDLSIWLSVDPMSDKYPSLSPYVYCADNPVKLVDPNGEEYGDYFDEKGHFLMNDGIDDGAIYVVNSEEWNCIWDDEENFPIEVKSNPDLLKLLCSAQKPSSANLSDNAISNILAHYNTTNIPLEVRGNNGNDDILFTTRITQIDGTENFSFNLYCNIKGWKNNCVFLNNSYDILSCYDNEIGHMKASYSTYMTLSEGQRELLAIGYQKMQKNYQRTSCYLKQFVENYYLQSANN